MTLREKAVTATFWLSAGSALSQAISYGSSLLLAALLIPEEMGKAAIGMLIISSAGLFREMGVGRALIYRKEGAEEAAHTGFFIVLMVSAILYLVLAAGADLAGTFFRDPDVVLFVRVMGLTLIINAFFEVPAALMERQLQFDRKTIADIGNLSSYSILVVLFAYLGYSFWSIAYAALISAAVGVLIIWRLSTWRPRFMFDKNTARELVGYGRRVVESTIVNFGIRNIDDAMVGRMLGTVSLGAYYLAYRIANIPATAVTPIIGKVMFPVYTQLSEHTYDLRNAFLKSLKIMGVFAIPISVELYLLAPGAITYAYDDKWQSAVLPIQILTLYGLIRSLSSGQGGIFMALDRVRTMTKISITQFILLGGLLYPAIHYYGLAGVCWVSVIGMGYTFLAHYIKMRPLIELRHRHVVQALWLSICGAGLAGGGAYLLCLQFMAPDTLAFLMLQPLITSLIYLPVMMIDGYLRSLAVETLSRFRGQATA